MLGALGRRIRTLVGSIAVSLAVFMTISAGVTTYFAYISNKQSESLKQQELANQMIRLQMSVLVKTDKLVYAIVNQGESRVGIRTMINGIRSDILEFSKLSTDAKKMSSRALTRLDMLSSGVKQNAYFRENLAGYLSVIQALKKDLLVAQQLSEKEALRGLEMQGAIYRHTVSSFIIIIVLIATGTFIMLLRKESILRAITNKSETFKREANRSYQELVKQKTIDQATHLPNRLSMIMREGKYHIALFDIRYFSMITRTYSRESSEKVLIDFFGRLQGLAEAESMEVYRYDADIAALIADIGVVGGGDFVESCERIYQEVKFYFYQSTEKEGDVFPILVTVGVSDGAGAHPIHGAEEALSSAKTSEKGMVVFQEDADLVKTCDYKEYAQQILAFWKAKEENCIIPYYQAIVDISTLIPIKYEALVRIKDGDIIKVPAMFIGSVYAFGLNEIMTKIMFLQAWEHANSIDISFNLSISDIDSPSLCSLIFGKMAQDKVRAAKFTFEIVESENEEKSKRIENFILMVKQFGGKIAIDDFGTGYSNFQRLASEWMVDIVKIDGSIIRAIKTDKNARGIVMGIVQIAKNAGIKTVAEFVYDEEILLLTRECGVDYAQGYLTGKPIPFEEIN